MERSGDDYLAFLDEFALTIAQHLPARALLEHEGLEWQRAVVDIPAPNAVAENQLFRARAALETSRAQFTPPLSESLQTGNLARNALYDSGGLEYTTDLLTAYIGELNTERARRRKAQGLGGGLLKNVDSNLILLRHSDACDPDC